jgi:hypothetical protein
VLPLPVSCLSDEILTQFRSAIHSAITLRGLHLPGTTWQSCHHPCQASVHSPKAGSQSRSGAIVSRGTLWRHCNASSARSEMISSFEIRHQPLDPNWTRMKMIVFEGTQASQARGQMSKSSHGMGYLLKMRTKRLCIPLINLKY